MRSLVACGSDVSAEVPPERWGDDGLAQLEGEVALRVRHGGFLRDAAHFDNARFSVSPAESVAVDPQQRLLLESSYAVGPAAGVRRHALPGSGVGGAVGIT